MYLGLFDSPCTSSAGISEPGLPRQKRDRSRFPPHFLPSPSPAAVPHFLLCLYTPRTFPSDAAIQHVDCPHCLFKTPTLSFRFFRAVAFLLLFAQNTHLLVRPCPKKTGIHEYSARRYSKTDSHLNFLLTNRQAGGTI